MSKVNVQFFSFGQKWGMYPNGPSDETLQFVVDVRGVVPDPKNHFRDSGTSPEVARWVKNQPSARDWLTPQIKMIKSWVETALAGDYRTLKVFYMCKDGHQQSVVAAEWVFWELQMDWCDALDRREDVRLYPPLHLSERLASLTSLREHDFFP